MKVKERKSVDSLRGLILGISVLQVKSSYVKLIKWEGRTDIRSSSSSSPTVLKPDFIIFPPTGS